MDDLEYLLSYGLLGDFGRFRAVRPLSCRRGDRVVARSPRGLEIAEVLRAAAPGHARFLPNTTIGQLLRHSTSEDEAAYESMRSRGRQLLERGQELTGVHNLPLEFLDVEVLLEGDKAVLHHVRGADCDVRPLVSTLAREFSLQIELLDLGAVPTAPAAEELPGCGRENCGGGHCSSCGSGGSCSSCGSAPPDEVQGYFAEQRENLAGRQTLL